METESQHRYLGGWIANPNKTYWTGFSDNPSASGEVEGVNEDLIAERIYQWWISGKSYSRWYADEYLQGKLDL